MPRPPAWLPEGLGLLGHHRIAHGGAVNSVAVTRDGQAILSGGFDRAVRLWSVRDGRLLRRYVGIPDEATAVAISPDDVLVAAASRTGRVLVWDAQTGKLVREIIGVESHPVLALSFDPTGRHVIFGGQAGVLQTLSATTGDVVANQNLRAGVISAVAVSRDGRHVAVACDQDGVRLLSTDPATRGQYRKVAITDARAVAFSPDSRTLAVVDARQTVVVVEVASGQQRGPFASGSAQRGQAAVGFSPDSETVIIGGADGRVHLIAADRGASLGRLDEGRRHMAGVTTLAVSAEGVVVTGSVDRTVRLWDLTGTKQPAEDTANPAGALESVAFNPVGNSPSARAEGLIALAGGGDDRRLRVWWVPTVLAQTPQPPWVADAAHDDGLTQVLWSRDGRRLAAAGRDGRVALWTIGEGGRPVSAKPEVIVVSRTGPVLCVAFSPDGRRLLTGGRDGTLRLWDATNAQALGEPARDHDSPIRAVAWSPDGRQVVSVSENGQARLRASDWSAPNTQGTDLVDDPAPVVVADTRAKVSLEDRLDRTTPWVSPALRAAVWSADGRRIAVAGDLALVRVYDPAGRLTMAVQVTRGPVRGLAFTADGRQLAIASAWGELAVIESASGVIAGWRRLPSPVEGLALSADGRTLATANTNGSVYLVEVDRLGDPLLMMGTDEGEETSAVTDILRGESTPATFAAAATAAGRAGPRMTPSDVVALTLRLGDAQVAIRQAASAALVQAGRVAVPALLTAYQRSGDNPLRRGEVLTTLARMGPVATHAATLATMALSDPVAPVRAAAGELLAALGTVGTPELLRLAAHNDAGIRAAAERGLADLRRAAELASLASQADRPRTERVEALKALGRLGRKAQADASEGVWAALADSDAELRAAAATTLGLIDTGNTDTVAMLALMVGHAGEDVRVRTAAAAGLRELSRSAAFAAPAILGVLADVRPAGEARANDVAAENALRAAAAEALVAFGPLRDEDAALTMVAALDNEPRPQVRATLLTALEAQGEFARVAAGLLARRLAREMDPTLKARTQALVVKLASELPPAPES